MGGVLKLVDATLSPETIEALQSLLQEAEAGQIIGLAYVALHTAREFTADVTGEARRSPHFTIGTLSSLQAYLLDKINKP